MRRLTTQSEIEDAARALSELLGAHGEWFVREGAGVAAEIKRGEWDLTSAAGVVVFSYWGASGPRAWRVRAWEQMGNGLRLHATRRAGAERATLELVPRASAAEGLAALTAARLAVCDRVAALLAAETGLRAEKVSLSAGARRGEPGRYARVILRDRAGALFAATAPVVPPGSVAPEAFLASALIWLARMGERGRAPRGLWLAAAGESVCAVAERVSLLREDLRERIGLFGVNDGLGAAASVNVPALPDLLGRPAHGLSRPSPPQTSALVESLLTLGPEAIDVIRSRRGETLRFRGLPFARVRRVAGRELVWFGAGPAPRRRILDERNCEELLRLVSDLAEHRRADAADRRHALYRAAPEAWLESALRRDVTRLDPGLRLAPLHAQFRATRGVDSGAARPVDLLALRRDGRLVVIELKVAEDAALPLQGADYWRRITAHHRAGHIRRARLFGDADISEDPPLVYLVAPLLRFHRSFEALARCLTPEIEIYRFDINEDWRAGVRVMRRGRVGGVV